MPSAAAATKKQRALDALEHLPQFSQIHNRLIASLSAPEVSFAKIAELIEKDTVLAGNILGVVNSPLYGHSGAVNSVRHAVALLGINRVRNITLSLSVAGASNQANTGTTYSIREFNLHAVAVAILCDLLAHQLKADCAECAFVAGLFHDVGRLLTAIALPDEYRELSDLYLQSGLPPVDCERQLFGFTIAELSADVLAIWNLPMPIQNAVRAQDISQPNNPGTQAHLSFIVHVARQRVDQSGAAPPMQSRGEAVQDISSVGLKDSVEVVWGAFEDDLGAIKAYL